MQTFTDLKSRTWEIEITVGTVKKVRAYLDGTDLLQPQAVITRLADPIFLCDLLFVICKGQADKAGISDEQFAAGLGGDVLWTAKEKLTTEYILFFQNPTVRENLECIVRKLRRGEEKIQAMLTGKVDGIDTMLDEAIAGYEKEIETELKAALTHSRESLE